MALTDEFAEALGEIDTDEDLVPAIFTWNGNDYPCTASGASKGGKLEEFGFAKYEDVVVIVRGSLFGETRPVRGHTFEVGGHEYRIDLVLTAPNAAFLRIAGVNPSRGV